MATAKKTPQDKKPSVRAQLTPQASDDPIARAAAGGGQAQSSDEAAAEAKEKGDAVIKVIVPRTFRLTLDDNSMFEYREGVCQMPAAHFEHAYAKANGVKKHRGEEE